MRGGGGEVVNLATALVECVSQAPSVPVARTRAACARV
jgi:hypothetical protein